jgi:similar to stage IV sporulation protein
VGQNELLADGKIGHRILNICMKNRIVYRDPSIDKDGILHLWCTPYMSYILVRECREAGIVIEEGHKCGIPHFLMRQRRRWGLFFGAIVALIMILASDNYIWDIRVTGNERVTYTELRDTLSECGLRVGSRIRELDVDSIETKTMLACKDISWMTINIQGTHANIQIREAGKKPEEDKPTSPSNLVAIRDGQIEYLEIFSGSAVVKGGDVVRKGDILVSGIYDSNHYGMFVTRSSGKVFARTKRSFTVEIPLEYERKMLIESKTVEKYLIFFSKEIKVFENAGNMGSSCDTIESVELLSFFGKDRLPVGVKTKTALFYEAEKCRYTETEAMELAYYRLGEIIRNELCEAELLSKRIECEITDKAYVLYCTVECVENIAVMQEFEYVR